MAGFLVSQTLKYRSPERVMTCHFRNLWYNLIEFPFASISSLIEITSFPDSSVIWLFPTELNESPCLVSTMAPNFEGR